jgi:hypothetical protein
VLFGEIVQMSIFTYNISESNDFYQISIGFYFLNIQVLHSLDILKQEDIYDPLITIKFLLNLCVYTYYIVLGNFI